MIKEVSSIKDIQDKQFLIKYGQEFCIPCEMTENSMKEIESNYEGLPFYSCKNVDESISKGFTNLPVIELHKVDEVITLTDSSVMMNAEELKGWIDNND